MLLEMPFLGKVPLVEQRELQMWKEGDQSIQRNFKAYYSRTGVAVRIEYESEHQDDDLNREQLIRFRQKSCGVDEIVGLPTVPAPKSLVAYLEECLGWTSPDKAKRIWIDYVLVGREGGAPHRAVIVGMMGGECCLTLTGVGDFTRFEYDLDSPLGGCLISNGF